jgi:hypothetical protein
MLLLVYPLMKEAPIPIEHEAGWAPELIRIFQRRKESLVPARN